MRGKQRYEVTDMASLRITPAHAGKTNLKNLEVHTCQDHPRACGENEGYMDRLKFVQGSPPRMRGKQTTGETVERESGITPAHAGKTWN